VHQIVQLGLLATPTVLLANVLCLRKAMGLACVSERSGIYREYPGKKDSQLPYIFGVVGW
jgi:hypothetical protein